jgi:hypothetical protein
VLVGGVGFNCMVCDATGCDVRKSVQVVRAGFAELHLNVNEGRNITSPKSAEIELS